MLELEQEFLANGGEFREVEIQQYFEKIKTKSLQYSASDLKGKHDEEYCLPALTAGVDNQGLAFYVPRKNATILKNVISVSANGANTGVMFYQPKEFTVLQDSYAIRFKNADLSDKSYLYLVSALQKSVRFRFDWSNKAGWERIKSELFSIPLLNSTPAFSYMENYITELQTERLLELKEEWFQKLQGYLKVTGLSNYTLTNKEKFAIEKLETVEWATFNLKKLFGKATRGKRLKSANRISGNLPFVTAGETDMGISAFIDNKVEVFKKNTVTIDMFGSAKYRNYDYGADDHIAVVHCNDWQKNVVIFLTTAVHKVANAGQFSYARNFYAKDADELNISLPVKNGKIDCEFMALLGSAMHKLVITDVVKYADKEISAYQKVIN
ncbi:restriction endonuclease subunit S [Actinobacillus arthritidis]|uniref:restriction endonuclease subunit S n=1 Tax=Actinobacillus arthritidis TaxID=157339 RepID=UPI0024420B2C|nr:restriction endonuclease subunit S [Actinobacillus arthritidis]WGE90074.1 restriction endonuclease subunit S [Actinobacillus arthritidis]